MIVRMLLLAACATACSLCCAQDSAKVAQAKVIIPRHSVKFSPFHLLSFYPTVQMSYELKVAPLVTIQFDGGMVININDYDEQFKNKQGYKIKIEPRYYFLFSQRASIGWYVAGELYRNNVNFGRTSEQTECFDPDCQNLFIREYTYRMNYREHGLAFKFGFVKHFHPFLFEASSGFAVRFIDYTAPSYITEERGFERDWFQIPQDWDRTGFSPVINFRIGYRFP
jgi:hypothetical protein